MSLIKKLAGETAIYGLSNIISRVLLFIVFTIYLTRKFGKVEYGIYADMYSYAAVILTILIFRMDTALFRYGKKEGMDKVFSTTFWTVLGISILTLICIVPFDHMLAEALTYGDSPHYVRWFVYFLIFDALAAPVFAKLRIENRPIRFVILKFLNIIVTAGLIIFFIEVLPNNMPKRYESITSFFGMNRQVDFVFLANLWASGFVLLFMIPELRGIKFQFDIVLFKKMFWYVVPLVFVAIAGNINQAFAAPLQKYFLGSDIIENISNVAVYAAAAKLAIMLNLFTSAFNYAAEPFFFNNAENKNSLKIYGKVALAFTLVACLGALALIFYIDVIILLLGEDYRSGINVVPILLFAYIFLGLYYNVSIWYKLKDKTHIGAMISLVGIVVTIVISVALLPRFGAIVSAWAALACYIVMVVIGYIVGQKHYPVVYPVKSILGYILITAILAVGSLYLRHLGLPNIYFYIIITLVFGLFSLLIYKREWKDIISL